MKYGTRRAKPAGSAIEFCLLSARYVTLFRSLRLLDHLYCFSLRPVNIVCGSNIVHGITGLT